MPVPQGAASAGAAEVSNSAPRVRARREKREIIVSFAPQSMRHRRLVSERHVECSEQERPKQGCMSSPAMPVR